MKKLQKEIKDSKKRAKEKETAIEDKKSDNSENPIKEEKKGTLFSLHYPFASL